MRVLALDTTTAAGSVAVVDDDEVLIEEVGDSTRSHAERLPGAILRVVELSGGHHFGGDYGKLAKLILDSSR